MKYYKIIIDQTFIGIANSNNFLAQNPVNHWVLSANEITGQYVECNNKMYRDYWMAEVNATHLPEFTYASVEEIPEEEYKIYADAIEKQEEIIVPDPERPIVPVVPEETESPTLDFVRQSKLSEMSYACRQAIESGIDLQIQGENRHFSLTTQDQLNLMTLSATGEGAPYHADGQECTFYSAEEIQQLMAAMNKHKTYHTTYYNSLKNYINSLQTIEEIAAITYGIEIPDEYKSEVLKVIE